MGHGGRPEPRALAQTTIYAVWSGNIFARRVSGNFSLWIAFERGEHVPKRLGALIQKNVRIHQEYELGVRRGEMMHIAIPRIQLAGLLEGNVAAIKPVAARMTTRLIRESFCDNVRCAVRASIGHANYFNPLITLAQAREKQLAEQSFQCSRNVFLLIPGQNSD